MRGRSPYDIKKRGAKMKVISILNQKGGCGKTTTAVNLSCALSKRNQRTLLIDLDPQAHTTFSLGIKPTLKISDLLEDYLTTKPILLGNYVTQRDENLSVIASSVGLTATEQTLSMREDRLFILYKLLSQTTPSVDFCIIDCPPNLGILTLNAILAANYLLVPISCCEFSLRGVRVLNQVIDMVKRIHPTQTTSFYLLTQYDKRLRYSSQFLEKAKEVLKQRLLNTIIRTNISLREAASQGVSIFEYKPKARGAQDYTNLAQEIINITQDVEWARFFLKGKDFKEVYVIGDFTQWQKNENYKMKKLDQDTWTINIPLKKGKYSYKFFADKNWFKDPYNSFEEDDTFGGRNSVIYIK
jgi:chromosome partitioning protein